MAKGQKEVAEVVRNFTSGVITRASDLMLLAAYFRFEFDLGYDGKFEDEKEILKEFSEIKFKTIKRALRYLRTNNYLENSPGIPILTQKGKNKVISFLPRMKDPKEKEVLYLVNYEFPLSENKTRNVFRNFLKELGAKPYQQSLWITTRNPKEEIESFLVKSQKDINAIVSELTEDGIVGSGGVKNIARDIFKLGVLNDEYKTFLQKNADNVPRERLIFYYLSIFKKDPQLTSNFLPDYWQGSQAAEIYHRLTPNV